MTKVNINNKEYEYEELSENAKSQLNKIRYVQREVVKLKADLNVLRTAESVYYSDLIKEIDPSN